MNKAICSILLALSFACSAGELPEPSKTTNILSGTVGYTTDYIFRGKSQTQGGSAIQGSINLDFESGIYLNAWGSEVDYATNDSSYEIDYTLGYSLPLFTDKVILDLGTTMYTYDGDNVSLSDDVKEAYLGLRIGALSAKVYQEYGSDASSYKFYEAALGISQFIPMPFGIDFEAFASYEDNAVGKNVNNFGARASSYITENLYASVEYNEENDDFAAGLFVDF